jgi:hypothetical protein
VAVVAFLKQKQSNRKRQSLAADSQAHEELCGKMCDLATTKQNQRESNHAECYVAQPTVSFVPGVDVERTPYTLPP